MTQPKTPAPTQNQFWRYGLKWPNSILDIALEMEMIRQGGRWLTKAGNMAGEGLFTHFKNFQSLLWPEKVWHKWSLLELECYLKYRIIGVIGPASCVAGHTRVLNPLTREEPTIEELYETQTSPVVMTLNGPARASAPFIKGEADLYEVVLENGTRFTATAHHLVLTSSAFATVSSLQIGQFLLAYAPCHPRSTSAVDQLILPSNARRWMGEALSYSERYSPSPLASCDERPRLFPGSDQVFSLSQADVRARKAYASACLGGLERKPKHSHLCQRAFPPSTWRTSHPSSCMEISESPPWLEETLSHGSLSFQRPCPSHRETPPRSSFEGSTLGFSSNAQNEYLFCPSTAEYAVQRSAVASIRRIGKDFFYDLQVPNHHHYFAEGSIHHNSGKTFDAATNLLADYYVFSDCTTGLVSSTTKESLEMRVWGEIKKQHRLAKTLWTWLPGNLIEGRQRIVTDHRSEAIEGRDFRNGIVGVACFPSSTLVDTPYGKELIENIQVGQLVKNAAGTGTVTGTQCRIASRLLRVTLSDGRTIDTTDEHPFLTQRGWVKAVELNTFDMVFSSDETLCILRQGSASGLSKPKILQPGVQRLSSSQKLRAMRQAVSTVEPKTDVEGEGHGKVLQPRMRREVGGGTQKLRKNENGTVPNLREADAPGSLSASILFSKMSQPTGKDPMQEVWPPFPFNEREPCEASIAFLQHTLQAELGGHIGGAAIDQAYLPGTRGPEIVSRSEVPARYSNRDANENWSKTLVQSGYRFSGNETRGGNRWADAPSNPQARSGENEDHQRAWVAHIEVLEPSGDPRFDESRGGYPVYNIEVSEHPSYSVNGVIVHNCKRGQTYQGLAEYVGIKNKRLRMVADELQFLPSQFCDAIANLDKNPDFKCTGLGNPKDTTDALGKLCEPAAHLGGWDGGRDQLPGTKTWETRFRKGICIQLPGSDSPNLDGKMACPLITQEKIDADIAFFGKDSLQYTMMDEGRMPRGQGSRRVITRQMCLKFGAMEAPIWKDPNLTKIGWCDAAYRGTGGDRCTFGELNFGRDPADRLILALVYSTVIPIVDASQELPEDQITLFCKQYCEDHNIPPENFGFDSTGRGSLMSSMARLWSANVLAVEFGGPPTDRKVSNDLDVYCKDYYFNFVSELWYTSRYVVEAGQYRGMTEEMMDEGCKREWGIVGKNKIQVEPKDDMKLKTGRSPDLYDGMVTGIEVARRRGFVIEKLSRASERDTQKWKKDLIERSRKLAQSGQLTYNS